MFRYIQLPKLKHVLTIAILLRFMDCFMIYTEVVVLTGGGPGNATTFLSIDLVKMALGQFDLGPAAAMSLIYFLIILLFSWLFYTLMMRNEVDDDAPALSRPDRLHPLPDAADLLAPEHVVQDHQRDPRRLHPVAAATSRSTTIAKIFTDPTWYNGYINSLDLCRHQHRPVGGRGAAGRLRLLALPLPRRQASVLLAADQPHGAARGLRAALLQLYSAVGLFDTPWAVALAHTLFNIPLAVWILEGFMSGVPKELDETAYVDGYSFWRFFFQIFMPTIAAGIGVACFFCFMFSWVELLLAKTLTSVAAKPIAAVDDQDGEHLRLRARPAGGRRRR